MLIASPNQPVTQISKDVESYLSSAPGMVIGCKRVGSESGETIAVHNPAAGGLKPPRRVWSSAPA